MNTFNTHHAIYNPDHTFSYILLVFRKVKEITKLYTRIGIMAFAIAFASFTTSAQSNIYIGGTVRETGTNTPLNAVKVVVVKEETQSRIDSTYTNTFGEYYLFFVWTGIPQPQSCTGNLYPNPFTYKTTLEVYSPLGGNYTLQLNDLFGKVLLNQDILLNQGINTISLSGGTAGIRLISLTNGTDTQVYKAVQTQSSGSPLRFDITSGGTAPSHVSSFKSGTSGNDNILASGDLVRMQYTKSSHYPKDTVFTLALSQSVNMYLDKIVITYPHQLDGNALSSIAGKQIIDNTLIYIIIAEGDTAWVNTANEAFSFSWVDTSPVANVKVGGTNVPGHQPNEINVWVDDFNAINITFTGLIYDLSQPVLVNNQYVEPVNNAQIAGGDELEYTDATGHAVVTRSNLETDINNLPFNSYATPLIVSKNNIQTLNQTVYSNVGTNSQQIINVIQEYIHFLWGNSTTPEGTLVSAWKNGTPVHTGTVSGTNYETNQVTRTTKTFETDSVTFEKPGYVTFKENNVVLVDGGNKKEATLPQIQLYNTLNFTFKVFLESGEIVNTLSPNFSNTIQWPDGTTNNYPVNAQGEIIVSKILPINNNSFGTATLSNDTTDYTIGGVVNGVLPWSILREPHQKTNRANISQNESTLLVPNYTSIVPLDSLNNKILYEYTVRKKAEGQPGVWFRMDEYTATGLILSSGGPSKFIEIPTNIAQYIDFVQLGWNLTTGAPIPQTQLDRANAETFKTISISYLANGDTLLPPHRMYTAATASDPNWQALVARGFDNSAANYFHNSTPGNLREWIGTYSYNGQPRGWRTTARYNTGNSNTTIFVENYSAIYFIAEGTGNLTDYVSYNEQVTDLGKSMARTAELLDLGSGNPTSK